MSPITINTASDIASLVRGRRRELGLTQAELARQARVSRKWVSDIEGGKPGAEIGLLIRLLGELGITLAAERPGHRGPPTEGVDLDDVLAALRRP